MTSLDEEIVEQLADIEHQRWSDWQKYVHKKMFSDGINLCLSYEQFCHWERQINTPYSDLNEDEKNSDREQVKRYLPIIEQYIDQRVNEAYIATNQGADCCPDGHQTFYGAIMKSPQWDAWYKEQTRRFSTESKDGTFDIDESMGIGAISDEHLQAFFKFIIDKKLYPKGE